MSEDLIELDYISESVLGHLEMNTSGALLLTGDWGSGKTYHVKNKVFPFIEGKTDYIPIIVSLYGKTDVVSVVQEVVFSFLNQKGEGVKLSLGTIANNVKGLSDSVPFLKKYFDINKFLIGAGDNLFKLLPSNKILICFDDLERLSEKLKIDDILGIINELVENKGCKVLVIANEEKVRDKITFKEKAIEKTIVFTPDISSVYNNIIGAYSDGDFKEYMTQNKDYVLKSLTPNLNKEVDRKKLKETLSNIRTIKFAIEHFRQCFKILVEGKDLSDDLLQRQLKNLWIFVLSISCEFKKLDGISFKECFDLDNQANIAEVVSNWDPTDTPDPVGAVDSSFDIDEFIKVYYQRLSEEYIYYKEVYNFITGGVPLVKGEFLKTIDENFKVIDGLVTPAYELLNTFLRGYWLFTDEEYPTKLKELLSFVENGKYMDVISFLNAGIYLVNSAHLFGETKERIITTMKTAIDNSVINLDLNVYSNMKFNMNKINFRDQGLEELIAYIEEKIEELNTAKKKQDLDIFRSRFINDIESLYKDISPDENGIGHLGTAVYQHLQNTTIKEALEKWTSKDIMTFVSLLNYRHIENGKIVDFSSEKTFLVLIKNCIEEKNLEENLLSVELLKNKLLPIVEKCIAIYS